MINMVVSRLIQSRDPFRPVCRPISSCSPGRKSSGYRSGRPVFRSTRPRVRTSQYSRRDWISEDRIFWQSL